MKKILLILSISIMSLQAKANDDAFFGQITQSFDYWFQVKNQVKSQAIYMEDFKDYYDLAYYAVHKILKDQKNGWKIHRTANYDPYGRETFVGYKDIVTNNTGTVESALNSGYYYIYKGDTASGKRLIVNLSLKRYPETMDLVTIYHKGNELQLANEFKALVNEYVVEKNFYNYGAIEFVQKSYYDYRIHFMKNVSKLTYDWKDLILDSGLKSDAQFHTTKFLLDFPLYKKLGLKTKRGVVLQGPPGTGKSFLGQILIGQILNGNLKKKMTFISVSARHLTKASYVEKIFTVANHLNPAVVFMEDIDLLGIKNREEGIAAYTARMKLSILNEMLNGIDGVVDHDGLLMIGTTNRMEDVDAALLRSKRLGIKMYFGYPKYLERKEFFERLGVRMAVWHTDLKSEWLANESEGLSGADIVEIISMAKHVAFNEGSWKAEKLLLTKAHFEKAFKQFRQGRSDDDDNAVSFTTALDQLFKIDSQL